MKTWLDDFRYNPIIPLIESNNLEVSLTAQWHLLDKKISLENLWQLPEPQRIINKQKKDGSWEYPRAKERIRAQENYNQIETYRNLGYLIEKFGFSNKHPSIQNTAEYLFKFQTEEGDIRGIYGNQYTPNYSSGISELLIKAGYGQDKRIYKLFEWLISIRQADGGWAIPFRTQNQNLKIISANDDAIKPNFTMPFSHLITGVVLRAFAAHPLYKNSVEAKKAGSLLVSNIFKNDNYPDRSAKDFWTSFTFPFWFTDLISVLDSLSLLGFSKKEPEIENALNWLVSQQNGNGTWNLRITKGQNKEINQEWLALAICKIFKRFSMVQNQHLALYDLG